MKAKNNFINRKLRNQFKLIDKKKLKKKNLQKNLKRYKITNKMI
jgi:hypothetical protein